MAMTTPQLKIERIQRLSAEERLVQPSPEEWLKQQDEQAKTERSVLQPAKIFSPEANGVQATNNADMPP